MNVKLYTNNVITHELNLFIDGRLLDALIHIVHNHLDFDYIIVDDEDKIDKCQFRRYIRTVNDYCRKVCGYWYENIEEALKEW